MADPLGFADFTSAGEDLEEWVAARSWTTGDGPKLIFSEAAANVPGTYPVTPSLA